MKETAQKYHRERRGNCAQSVAFSWGSKNLGGRGVEEVFSGYGGGRAPGGLCGAVFAACELAGPVAAEAIKQAFAEKNGGLLTCREIRAAGKLSCNECVGLAAELLEQQVGKGGKHGE